MKKLSLKFSIIFAVTLLVFSCNKKEDDAEPTDDSSAQITTASDQSDVSTETEQALEDANTVLSGSANNGKIAAGSTGYAGISSIDSNLTTGTFVIHYNGQTADGRRTRNGTVTVQVGPTASSRWSDVNSYLTIYYNFTVTKIGTGKTLGLKGKRVITNLSGGNWKTLEAGTSTSVTHKVRGTDTITFDNNTTRIWKVAKNKVIAKDGSDFTITLSGDTTVNNISNVVTWGENRIGDAFYCQVPTPIVVSRTCYWRATQGKLIHKGISSGLTITYGVNSDGSIHTGTDCPYGYKLEWTGPAGNTRSATVSY